MQKLKHHRIQAILIVLTLTTSLLSALIIGITSIVNLYNSTRTTMLRSAEYNLHTAATDINQYIDEINSLENWCLVNSNIRSYLTRDISIQNVIANLYPSISSKYSSLNSLTYIQRFLISDGNSKNIQFGTSINESLALTADTISLLPGVDGLSDETAATISWKKIGVDPLLLYTQNNSIPVIKPIKNSGSIVGFVYISVSTDLITNIIKEYEQNSDGDLYLRIDRNLYSLGANGLEIAYNLDEIEYKPFDLDNGFDLSTEIYTVNDKSMYAISYPLTESGLYLVQTIPTSVFRHDIHFLQESVTISIICILMLGLIMAFILKKTIANRILALNDRINKISAGDFSYDPHIEWDNELGEIGRGINNLSFGVTTLMEKRLQDEKEKQDLEYRMLQNQVNPHFIYNTLSSIKWMATIQHAPGIAEMTTSLARLMKSVSKSNERLICLEDEFALLTDYFTIMKYRYGGTITFNIDCPAEYKSADKCMIPRFTLQPLAENSILHGIEPKNSAGNVNVSVEQIDDKIIITMTDDGIGIAEDKLKSILDEPPDDEKEAKFRHVGLWNVHKRIQYSFGEDYGLKVDSVWNEGTSVRIILPYEPSNVNTKYTE